MDTEIAQDIVEAMKSPNFKMLSVLLMATLSCMEDDQDVIREKMRAIVPKLGELSENLSPPLNSVFIANMIAWQTPGNSAELLFMNDDLSFQGMMELATEGVNGLHSLYESGAIEKHNMKAFYECVKEATEAVISLGTPDDQMVPQILATQDGIINMYS
jgi:hypothetical protein